ncbi:hypothetical protein [Kineococcus glutinatus]|uniref:hypothetical protein n=1 Tax=Kineococcus glutinatus TaxID=1070872 RepID=UPI0031E74F71
MVEQAPAVVASAPAKVDEKDRKLAVYLPPELDLTLDAIRFAGASQRPRVDVSKSAVVRLALERLLAQASHEEIVETIAQRLAEARAGRDKSNPGGRLKG